MTEEEWKAEWARLSAEREDARGRWSEALAGFSARLQDPLGARNVVRRHPLASTGIAAGASALVAFILTRALGSPAPRRKRKLVKKKRRLRRDHDRNGRSDAPDEPSVFATALRHAALQIATPLLTQFLQSKLSEYFDGDGTSDVEQNGHASIADTELKTDGTAAVD